MTVTDSDSNTEVKKNNFIYNIIRDDIANNKNDGKVTVRFPPEPNGYLHVGHAKSICLNFGIPKDFAKSICYLRFDDTNPEKESDEFIQAIQADIKWLGFTWHNTPCFTSDYFEKLYQCAITLIKDGKAYVCSLNAEQVREYRGTLTEAGRPSPDRSRSVEDNLKLFEAMKNGECSEGQYTLRAKIDMAAGNINLRDPAIYRIRKFNHHRTGNDWCIYPMYDFAHALSDAFEEITHSLCTLEFQDHRPLYDWYVENCKTPHTPRQIEFSRLNLSHTITSKRKLKQLVDQDLVSGWDDPRMPTLSGLRRRGFTPQSIKNFCSSIGISKQDSIIDMSLLEESVRDDLNKKALRRIALLNPIKVIITNYPKDKQEMLHISNHPQQAELGKRSVPFSGEIFIDADDFSENPPKKFFRLAPGKRVRLLNGYVIQCDKVIKDGDAIVELHCSYDPDTLGGKKPQDGTKVKGIIQWLEAQHAQPATIRVYDRLFNSANPAKELSDHDLQDIINPDSLSITKNALIETDLCQAEPEQAFQFTRTGYFVADRYEHSADHPVFNRVVPLRQTWDNIESSSN